MTATITYTNDRTLPPVNWDSWRVMAIFHPVRGMELGPLRGAIVPGGGRRYMGQVAGFQEPLRTVAVTGQGFARDLAGLGLAVLVVRVLRCC